MNKAGASSSRTEFEVYHTLRANQKRRQARSAADRARDVGDSEEPTKNETAVATHGGDGRPESIPQCRD